MHGMQFLIESMQYQEKGAQQRKLKSLKWFEMKSEAKHTREKQTT